MNLCVTVEGSPRVNVLPSSSSSTWPEMSNKSNPVSLLPYHVCFPWIFVLVKDKLQNLATLEGWLVIWFLNDKNVHPTEIHRQIVAVCGDGTVKEGYLRKQCLLFKEGMTMHECILPPAHNLNSSSGKFSSILHTVLTSHQVIITCISTSRNCSLLRVWGVTKRQNMLCRTGWKPWQQPFWMKANKWWSHDMIRAYLIYVATMWRGSLLWVLMC